MKIEQLIVHYFYQNKKVTLQGIGTFILDPVIAMPDEIEDEFTMPQNAVTFEYNAKVGEDGDLINHIVQKTGKIRSLAISDLDSYIILINQFLNIGKPLWIKGLGTLFKNQNGYYEFIAGNLINSKITIENTSLKEKPSENINFQKQSGRLKSKKNIWIMMAIIIIIALVVVGLILSKKQLLLQKNYRAYLYSKHLLKQP